MQGYPVVMGSVTERVLHHSKLLLFIVRPTSEQAARQKGQRTAVEVSEVDMQSWVGLL